MGWLRLVRSFKLQVSFAEYRLLDRARLQKRPIILRSLLIEATPFEVYRLSHVYFTLWVIVGNIHEIDKKKDLIDNIIIVAAHFRTYIYIHDLY